MEDRYLYRAKRTDNGELVQGYLVETRHNTYHDGYRIIDKDGINYDELDYYEPSFISYVIDPSTICQCTGLTDKNGNKIWENDIVSFQFDNDDCPFPNKDTKKRIGKVFFSDFRASWSITMGKNGSKSLNNDLWKYVQNGNRVEVIGSAIDNPELL